MRSVALLVLCAVFAAPAISASAETINVPFTAPDTATAGSYGGVVDVTVSGVGQSDGASFNDAFYVYSGGSPYNDGSYYQLNFSTNPLAPYEPGANAKYSLVGPLPAYSPSHIYTFQLRTGLTSPGLLHFGVADGQYGDNSGAYTISVAVPEPGTWALMTLGLFGLGAVMRRRRRAAV